METVVIRNMDRMRALPSIGPNDNSGGLIDSVQERRFPLLRARVLGSRSLGSRTGGNQDIDLRRAVTQLLHHLTRVRALNGWSRADPGRCLGERKGAAQQPKRSVAVVLDGPCQVQVPPQLHPSVLSARHQPPPRDPCEAGGLGRISGEGCRHRPQQLQPPQGMCGIGVSGRVRLRPRNRPLQVPRRFELDSNPREPGTRDGRVHSRSDSLWRAGRHPHRRLQHVS